MFDLLAMCALKICVQVVGDAPEASVKAVQRLC